MHKTQKSRTNSLPPPAYRRGFTLIGPKDHDRNVVSGRERTHRAAFTLIELIVVMAVIGVLVLLAAPKFLNYTARARETHIRNDIKVLESKIDEYLINHGTLPEEWKTGGSKQGKKCSLLTVEKDGPVPISLSDIEQFETKYPLFSSGIREGVVPEGESVGFYRTKIDGEEGIYFYSRMIESVTGPPGPSGTFEMEMFLRLEDMESSISEGADFEPKYPSYTIRKFNGEEVLMVGPPIVNMEKAYLPRYYAKYDKELNIVNDDCYFNDNNADSSSLIKLFKDSEPSSSEGITGKLYDKSGPIDSMPSGDFQLVDRLFYPESKLDGNFYANNDGVVIYEDKDGTPNAGGSLDNEKPIAVASSFLLTNKNLYFLHPSGEYVTVETDKWNTVNDIKNIENTSNSPVVAYTDAGIYVLFPPYESDPIEMVNIEMVKLEDASEVYISRSGNSHYIDKNGLLYKMDLYTLYEGSPLYNLPLPAGIAPHDVKSVESQDSNIFLLTEDGTVYVTGNNDKGQLGNGTIGGMITDFQLVPGLNSVINLAAASNSEDGIAVYALQSSGDLYGWGNLNNYGNKLVPSIIKSRVSDFATRDNSVNIIDKDGKLVQIKRNGDSRTYLDGMLFKRLEDEYAVSIDNNWYYVEDYYYDDVIEDYNDYLAHSGVSRIIGVANSPNVTEYFGVVELESGKYDYINKVELDNKSIPAEITGNYIGLFHDDKGNLHYVTENNVWIGYIGPAPFS